MKQKVTIEDVAKHCQVSKSSVSRYLNNGYVSEENKEKIKKGIEELGFERDFFASRLKAKRSRLVGIIANCITKSENALILEGMQRKLNALGYQGVILLSEGDQKKEQECLTSFVAQGVDGVIFLDCDQPEHVKEIVERTQMKVLFANHSCTFAPFLDVEEKRAGQMLGEYFVERHAHSFLSIEHDVEKGKKREDGFVKAYEAHDESCHIETHNVERMEDVYEIAHEIIGKSYDAVLCEREEYAFVLLKYFHEVHVHVPQNIGIACFGGSSLSQFCSPAITAITCDYGAFGANLVEELVSIVEQREPHWEDVALTMVERESVRRY